MPRQTVNESTDTNTFNKAAAPQAVQDAVPEAIEQMAADRYKVVPSHESMFHRWAVVADNGAQQLYIGREGECQNMARKFMGAFLDGAFVAMQNAAPPHPTQGFPSSPEDALDADRWIGVGKAIFGDEDHVLVPRGLIGAACCAIDKKRDGTKTLAELRRYTTGDLSAATPAAITHTSTEQPEALRLIEWFAESNGFNQGTKPPHKWVLQAEQELRRLHARIAELESQLEATQHTQHEK